MSYINIEPAERPGRKIVQVNIGNNTVVRNLWCIAPSARSKYYRHDSQILFDLHGWLESEIKGPGRKMLV